jgi:hypothetical protein
VPLTAIALLATLALVLPGGAAASQDRARWRRPLPGAVVGSFSFDSAAPYERGRRRGIDLLGSPGAPVVAACSGVVTHAGAVPRWGAGVTVLCGRLVATHLGLTRVAVRRGAAVRRGMLLGSLARRAILRLGARRAGVVHGYVDPEPLLGSERPWGAAPVGRPPMRRRPRPRTTRAARRVGLRPGPGAVRNAPSLAWAGLALVAAGAGGASGAVPRIRRRRAQRRAEASVAHR